MCYLCIRIIKLFIYEKITFIAALLVCATFAFAQVTKGTIGNGSFTNWQGTETQEYGIDFDNDGALEVAIKLGYDYGGDSWNNGSVEYVYDSVLLVSIDAEENWDKFLLMGAGTSVSGSQTLSGFGDGTFADFTVISTDSSYVGFAFVKNSITYYAYAKIHRSNNYDVIWDDVYYEATAGTGITTGDLPQPTGVENVNAEMPQVRMVAIEGVIYIERDGKLYDFSGRQVK